MATLNQFIANIKSEGLMRNSRFAITFTPPRSMQGSGAALDLRKILLYCDNVNLPGMTLETTQAKTFGEYREMPFNKLFDNINMSFYVDNSMQVKRMFDSWMGAIQNPQTRSFNYYKDYTTNITIEVFDVADKSRYQVVLYQCYPKTINPITLDYADKEVMKMTVSMNYKYWISSSVTVTTKPNSATNTTNGLFGDYFTDSQIIPDTYFTSFNTFQTGFNSFEQGRASLFSSETASTGRGSRFI
jgi:hypothetical protein